jgi:hypothetical protein
MNKLPKKTQGRLDESSFILPGDTPTLNRMILEEIYLLDSKISERMALLEVKIDEALSFSQQSNEKESSFIDTKTLAKEFQSLKKENTELKNRLGKIEVELSKRHIVGIHNLILSHDAIDEIWDEEDDTL